MPPPLAAELIATVQSIAFVPSTFAATIWLILKTLPEDAAFASKTLAVVLDGVAYAVFPITLATLTILGAAILTSENHSHSDGYTITN